MATEPGFNPWRGSGASIERHREARQSRAVGADERAAIDAAVAAGRVTRCPTAWVETLEQAPRTYLVPVQRRGA